MLPTGPVYLDNAIVVRDRPESQNDAYKTVAHFAPGQNADRLLRKGNLYRDKYQKYPNVGYSIYGNKGTAYNDYVKISADTPLEDTIDISRFAVVRDGDDPASYFGPNYVRNAVGVRPDLDAYRDIEGVPEEDKRNVYAHQLLNGLSSMLRAYGVTEGELRSVGIDGYDGINTDSLVRLRRGAGSQNRIGRALRAFTAAMDGQEQRDIADFKNIDNFIRANYRPGEYHVRPDGVPERTRLYAKGGSMPKAAPERIRHEGRVLARVGGDEREDWYI